MYLHPFPLVLVQYMYLLPLKELKNWIRKIYQLLTVALVLVIFVQLSTAVLYCNYYCRKAVLAV